MMVIRRTYSVKNEVLHKDKKGKEDGAYNKKKKD